MSKRLPMQIKTLADLEMAVKERKALYSKNSFLQKPCAAAFVYSMQGSEISKLIRHGLYVYVAKSVKKRSWFNCSHRLVNCETDLIQAIEEIGR